MTLIQSYISTEFILQVCDRRLTTFPGFAIRDNDALKAVLFNNHTTFAYTGLAELPRSKRVQKVRGGDGARVGTNLWLGEVLALGDDLQTALQAVQQEATITFNKMAVPPEQKRHAFVGVGWMNWAVGDALQPAIYEIFNFRDRSSFEINVWNLGPDVPYVAHSSHPLPGKLETIRDRQLRHCMDRGTGPGGVSRVLMKTIREVAKGNRTVGRGLLLTCLPRSQIEKVLAGKNWEIGAGQPSLDHVTFQHVPSGTDDGLQHGPTVVIGKTVMAQLSLGPDIGGLFIETPPPANAGPA